MLCRLSAKLPSAVLGEDFLIGGRVARAAVLQQRVFLHSAGCLLDNGDNQIDPGVRVIVPRRGIAVPRGMLHAVQSASTAQLSANRCRHLDAVKRTFDFRPAQAAAVLFTLAVKRKGATIVANDGIGCGQPTALLNLVKSGAGPIVTACGEEFSNDDASLEGSATAPGPAKETVGRTTAGSSPSSGPICW
jgi:hypothetical protein